ncbi:acyl-CoA synthetase family protein [Novipirellula artificiosorum]|uniref:Phenylacetate-coenzyme A ligase n=1 Tax=Novipirellula artificiosorum TaxID=2528016 RepID=A0A5C6DBV8_9BACT|nr:phenylacetate--CoA ligase [Novipirellula artificiosorum]TWU34250.1 Phenylacetate-coenzyme A ligase [Novipirellula artificiosorum]
MTGTPSARLQGFATRESLQAHQLARLNALLTAVRDRPFYCQRLQHLSLPLRSLDELAEVPLLEKADLVPASPATPACIFDLPMDQYTRLHQTSGTSGWPLPVLDTADDWQWWLDCWQYVLDAAEVSVKDIAMMAFSFGPFIGFWTANDAMIARGALVVPGGGLTSEARLKMIHDYHCTVLCCTPTYALHLVAVAKERSIELTENRVSRIIVAGEPGGSIASVRKRIEDAWGARVIDHSGASELGAWGVGSVDGGGLHVIESEFIAETLQFDQDHPQGVPAAEGELAELVLTNLGRLGGPAIRYRTGDIVRAYRKHDAPSPFLWLRGGVIGRADDMIVIRGVNVFPSSIEAILREIDAAAEYLMIVDQVDEMDQLRIEIESVGDLASVLAAALRNRLALRIDVAAVPHNSLPRSQAKSRRLIDNRKPLS